MAWFYLMLAGVAEIGWPLGFKMSAMSSKPHNYIVWIIFSLVSMAVSGVLLYIAQKNIPIGTAYIIWTGIGGIGTFILGVLAFGDPLSVLRICGAVLVVFGLVLLRFAA